jgi:hypothetical protein
VTGGGLPGIALAALAGVLAIQPAAAQTPSAAARSGPGIDPALCRTLTRHRPAPDVEYRPGVDVKGRPVAPADLPGSAGAMAPAPLDIPLTLDLARRMGVRTMPGGQSGALPGDTVVGRLTMDGNRLLLNGQPVDGASEAQLYAYCRTR